VFPLPARISASLALSARYSGACGSYEAGKRLTHVLGFNHIGKNRGRIRRPLRVEDIAAHARPMYASDQRMMRVGND
jgi:hypothetical protein